MKKIIVIINDDRKEKEIFPEKEFGLVDKFDILLENSKETFPLPNGAVYLQGLSPLTYGLFLSENDDEED